MAALWAASGRGGPAARRGAAASQLVGEIVVGKVMAAFWATGGPDGPAADPAAEIALIAQLVELIEDVVKVRVAMTGGGGDRAGESGSGSSRSNVAIARTTRCWETRLSPIFHIRPAFM